ncbi:MAG: alpha/beta hydrolase [Phycisphaerae bacterium]
MGQTTTTGTPRQPMTVKRQIKRLAFLLAGAYVMFALIAAFFSERLLFRPHASSYRDSAEIIKLTTSDGVRISALHLTNPAARYTILHSHGNGEDMGDDRDIYRRICRAGFNVLAYDYHGYGTSGGSPCERSAYADIDAAYAYLTTQLGIPPEQIILYGRSVGGGPATDLATRQPVAGLILESAFVSAFRTAVRVPLLPWDKFKNLAKLPAVRCPILVIHGEDDMIVPAWHGHRLYKAAPGEKQCLWVPGAGHNDLIDVVDARYDKALQNFASLIEHAKSPTLTTTDASP